MNHDGIVIAGGAGTRMGGPKAVAALGGRTLVELAVMALAPHCGRVVVVTRPGIPLPALRAEVLLDRPGPDAPLTGLATGLAACTAAEVLVLACDLPLAAPVVARLAALPPGRAAVAEAGGRMQPLCARYPREAALAAAEALLDADTPRMMRLLDLLDPVRVRASAQELLNVNTPDGLARAAGLRGDRAWAAPSPRAPGGG